MSFDFDRIVARRGTGSMKWELYGEAVLPMWVADMDFPSPEPVLRALHARVEQGFFGYEQPSARLAETICAWLARHYQWQVTPDQLVFVPSLVTCINLACRMAGAPGDRVLTHTPAYPPFLSAPANHGMLCDTVELLLSRSGQQLSYTIDFDAFEAAFQPQTRLFLLCNPHNPTGQAYDPATLERIAEICLRHDAIICSDEIHCDLLLGGTQHTPLARLAPEIAARTVTLIAPSKTFNLPGLKCGVAIAADPELRKRLQNAAAGLVTGVNALGMAACEAAYGEGWPWLEALRAYLTENRATLLRYIAEQLPQLATTTPEATYLAWLDCREAGISGNPYEFFLKQAQVALSDGAHFGPGGEGFVRLNFGCPRSLLLEGLERMRNALG